jgi:hypothetical protein
VPTPTASLFGCKDVDKMLTRRAKYAEKYGNNGFGLTLQQWVAMRFMPTPTATDWKGSTGKGSPAGTLAERCAVECGTPGETVYPHPEFVEELMGFPTGFTDCGHSATPLTCESPAGSASG